MRTCSNVVAWGGLVMWVVAVLVEHALSPSLSPMRHQISEYVHGKTGWLMVVAFLAWALSLAATAVATKPPAGVVALLLGTAAVGFVVAAVWATQTSAGELPPGVQRTTAGRLHDLGSGVASIALAAAAVASVMAIRVTWFRRATMALLGTAVVADLALLAVGAEVGGVRQRILIAAAVAWQAALLTARGRSPDEGKAR